MQLSILIIAVATAVSVPSRSQQAPSAERSATDALTIGRLWAMLKQAVNAWLDDYAPSMGAALAYYTMFSLAPLLILVIAVAGLVFGQEAARGQIVAQLGGLVGKEGAEAIQGLLKSAGQTGSSIVASAIGVVTLLIGATSIFAELQSDLDRIWRAPATAPGPAGLWGLIRTRLLSLGMVGAIGFLLLVSLVVSAMLSALGDWWGSWFGGWAIVLQLLNQVTSFGIITALFALMYRLLPRVKVGWHDVWIGSAATALLFTIGKYVVGVYLGRAGVTSGFGAAGSLVVLLVWVYYSSQLFLLGAEFTWVYTHRHDSRAVDASSPETAAPRDTKGKAPQYTGPADGASRSAAASTNMDRTAPAEQLVYAAMVSVAFGVVRWLLRTRPSTTETTDPPRAAYQPVPSDRADSRDER